MLKPKPALATLALAFGLFGLPDAPGAELLPRVGGEALALTPWKPPVEWPCPWPWADAIDDPLCSPFPPETIPGPPFGPFPPRCEPDPPRCEVACGWCPPGRHCATVCRIECREPWPPCLIPEGCPCPPEPFPWRR